MCIIFSMALIVVGYSDGFLYELLNFDFGYKYVLQVEISVIWTIYYASINRLSTHYLFLL